MTIQRGDALALARALVAVDSRNPALAPDAPGELPVARVLADILRSWDFRVEIVEAASGRPNVIARVGRAGAPSLMLNGHLDTVGTDGMTHAPFQPVIADGRLYGRGASDMKGGIAAMCAAAARASNAGLEAELVITAVADEEWESIGTRALVESGVRADAAIVTEPTRLTIAPAHKGFVWLEVTVHGHAAHGSRHDAGVDAIRHAGLLLAELDRLDVEVLPRRRHPLLGRGSIHASLISGGIGMSTYPDRCSLKLERRTIPGTTPDDAQREVEDACMRVRELRPEFSAEVAITFAQNPSDVSADAPVVHALVHAIEDEGLAAVLQGASYWSDAAILNEAGIPAVCFGPGDIALAHGTEEWLPIAQLERATKVLERVAYEWGRAPGTPRANLPAWRS